MGASAHFSVVARRASAFSGRTAESAHGGIEPPRALPHPNPSPKTGRGKKCFVDKAGRVAPYFPPAALPSRVRSRAACVA